MSMAVDHIQKIGKYDEWRTPPALFRKICKAAGIDPKLDVAADARNSTCIAFYDRDGDALTQPWHWDFWCNPPYTLVDKFVARAAREVARRNISGILLTYAKTETAWWHKYVEGQPGVSVNFIKERVNFLNPDGTPSGPAPYPSCWIVMRHPEVP